MSRTRLLHPQQTIDEDVNGLKIHARYVWAFLPCHADKEGRLLDKPFSLKLAILPADNVDMNAILDEIAGKGFITRYVVDGRHYIQIRTFAEHQHPHRNEASSNLPPVPSNGSTGTHHGPASSGNVASRTDHGPSIANPAESEGSRNYPSETDQGPLHSGGSGSGSGSGEVTGARAPDPGATGTVHPLPTSGSGSGMTAHDVVHKFGIRWRAKYGLEWAHDPNVYALARDLLENQIGAITDPAARAHAIEDLPNAMDRYLADTGKDDTLTENKHPFPWFVTRYNKHRFASVAATPPGTRPRWVRPT